MGIEKHDWMIYENILMSVLTPHEWLVHEGFLYVSHNLKRFKKRKELIACHQSICLFEQKGIDWLKSYMALKWKEMDLRALQKKTVVATSMIPISLKV